MVRAAGKYSSRVHGVVRWEKTESGVTVYTAAVNAAVLAAENVAQEAAQHDSALRLVLEGTSVPPADSGAVARWLSTISGLQIVKDAATGNATLTLKSGAVLPCVALWPGAASLFDVLCAESPWAPEHPEAAAAARAKSTLPGAGARHDTSAVGGVTKSAAAHHSVAGFSPEAAVHIADQFYTIMAGADAAGAFWHGAVSNDAAAIFSAVTGPPDSFGAPGTVFPVSGVIGPPRYVLRAADDNTTADPLPSFSVYPTEWTIGAHASLRLDAAAAAAAALAPALASTGTSTTLDKLFSPEEHLHGREDELTAIAHARPLLYLLFAKADFAREVDERSGSVVDFFESEATCNVCTGCQQDGNCDNVWKLDQYEHARLAAADSYEACIGIARRINYARSTENNARATHRAELTTLIARYSGAGGNQQGWTHDVERCELPPLEVMHFGSADHLTAAVAVWGSDAAGRLDAIGTQHLFIRPFETVFYTRCASALEPARVRVTGPRVNHRATVCIVDAMFVSTPKLDSAIGMAGAVLGRMHNSAAAGAALADCVRGETTIDPGIAAAAASLVLACRARLVDPQSSCSKVEAASAEELCTMLASNLVRLSEA
jgi:hypothetical protein